MSKFYSDNIQEQIDDLFYVESKETAEPVVRPVVKEVVEPKQKSVIKEEVYYTEEEEPVSYIEQMAQQMSRVNKRTNSAAGQEKISEEQLTLNNFQTQIDGIRRALRESTMVSGIGQGGDGQTPGSGEVKLSRLDDVSIDNIQDGESLVWDSTSGKFIPGTVSAGTVSGRIDGGDADGNTTNNNSSGGSGGGDTLILTSDIQLTSILASTFNASGNYTILPNAPVGSTTQEDVNQWAYIQVFDVIDEALPVAVGETPPSYITGHTQHYEGRLWFNSSDGESKLYVYCDGQWKSAHPPVDLSDYATKNYVDNLRAYVDDQISSDMWLFDNQSEFPPASDNHGRVVHSHSDGAMFYAHGGQWIEISNKTYVDDAIDAIPPVDLEDYATEAYVNQVVDAIPPVDLEDYATKTYVDDAIENLGDILNFKGILDFTSESEPGVYQTGDVYVNTGTGVPDNSWSLSNDVSPGEMYGRGETQWALIGSSGVDLTGYATQTDVDDAADLQVSKSGDTMSGALNFLRGDKPDKQFKISPNGGDDYATNIYSFQGQMRFRTTHSDVEGDYTSHIILIPDENNPQTKIWNVVETNDTGAVPRSYVDEKVDGSKTYTDEQIDEAKTYTDEQIAALPSASTGVPVGSIMIWMNSTAPDGWFKLQGGSFNVNTYPLLHAYLERTEGYTSGTLPNWSGRYPGEYGNHITYGLGTKVDYETARPKTPFTTDNPGSHKHRYGNNAYGGGATNSAHDARNHSKYESDSAGAHTHTITGGGDSTTRPRTVVVHYIIKHD